MQLEPRWAYKVGSDATGADIDAEHDRERSSEPARRTLLCVSCRNEVTTDAERIVVNERHDHTFANPGGYGYHIGCFGDAPGVRPKGIPSGHWTWFAGYMWQLDVCTSCGHHLGWLFRAREHSFHGLILKRLIEGDVSG